MHAQVPALGDDSSALVCREDKIASLVIYKFGFEHACMHFHLLPTKG